MQELAGQDSSFYLSSTFIFWKGETFPVKQLPLPSFAIKTREFPHISIAFHQVCISRGARYPSVISKMQKESGCLHLKGLFLYFLPWYVQFNKKKKSKLRYSLMDSLFYILPISEVIQYWMILKIEHCFFFKSFQYLHSLKKLKNTEQNLRLQCKQF